MENFKAHLLQLSNEQKEWSWSEKIDHLYSQQLEHWGMARNNYQQLASVERRSISFGHFRVDIQHNPARVRSTCADLSKKVIEQRPCFLCAMNLPDEQKGFVILNKYLLLINPYPIFERHLTISDINHVPQRIENRIIDLLLLAKELEGFTVFYNGPKCGASAPDHFHFQVAQSGIMPIDIEMHTIITKLGSQIFNAEDIRVYKSEDYLRETIVLESGYKEPIDYFFNKIYYQLPFDDEFGEPMMNLLASFEDGQFRLTIFPRKVQRPSCFFKNDPERILVSPASVEMGGLIIIPRKEDFQKITVSSLIEIFNDVSQPFYFSL